MKPTVLIAEGDSELCGLYQEFLTTRGYQAETASNGLDCLAKLRRATPAAVVLDLELRWGGGDGVLAWLRAEGVASGVPVILTSRVGYPVDGAVIIEPPVVQFLLKPFALSALHESVRSAIAQRQEPVRRTENVPVLSELFLG
jgi:two-component system response regulator PrrA